MFFCKKVNKNKFMNFLDLKKNNFSFRELSFENKQTQAGLSFLDLKISNLEDKIDLIKFESEGKVDEIKKKLGQEKLLRKKLNQKEKFIFRNLRYLLINVLSTILCKISKRFSFE